MSISPSARLLVASAVALAAGQAFAAPFTPGNAVVYRAGDAGRILANTGAAVFVDEFTPAGVLVQSYALPTSGANAVVASGTATSEGLLTVSPDGRYITVTGYNTTAGIPNGASLAGTAGSAIARAVAVIDATTGALSVSTFADFATGNNPRSAVTTNGTDLYLGGGAGGVRYASVAAGGTLGATSTQLSTTVTNVRQVNIFDGQLYTSSSSGSIRVGTVGAGLPTTAGQTITNLPGLPITGSPYAYFLADLSAAVAGVDTLYIADDGVGLLKYSLVAGSWTANGVIGVNADDYVGVTGTVTPAGVSLFATRKGGASANGGGELVSLLDASGYNATITGAPTLLASAVVGPATGFNTAFRGVGVVGFIPTPGSAALIGLAGLAATRRRRTN